MFAIRSDLVTRIAVIGAGLSGLVFADLLGDVAQVKLFEKSHGYGGCMSTWRHDTFQFDHGAQFFTAKSKSFEPFLKPYLAAGVVARWDARFVEISGDELSSRRSWSGERPHYVGVPGMNALARTLGEKLNISLGTRIEQICGGPGAWELLDVEGRDLGRFDWIVSSVPARQLSALMPGEFRYLDDVEACSMPGCYSLMLGFTQPLPLEWDAALVKDSAISWISVDNSKPGRVGASSLLVQTSNQWAEANMELANDSVIARLIAETDRVIGQNVSEADHVELHRWRYANPGQREGAHSLIDAPQRLAATGDWCIRGRVESAFLSGLDAAQRIRKLI
jgi:renalase